MSLLCQVIHSSQRNSLFMAIFILLYVCRYIHIYVHIRYTVGWVNFSEFDITVWGTVVAKCQKTKMTIFYLF